MVTLSVHFEECQKIPISVACTMLDTGTCLDSDAAKFSEKLIHYKAAQN